MSIRIKNVGVMVGNDTNGEAVYGDQGTVRVIYQNQEFVWGPNETKSFSDNGIGAALAAQDSRLRVMTDADGLVGKANASVTFSRW